MCFQMDSSTLTNGDSHQAKLISTASHKWTIDDFNYYLRVHDKLKIPFIISDKFVQYDATFWVELYINDESDSVSVFVNCELKSDDEEADEETENDIKSTNKNKNHLLVYCSISILNRVGKLCYTKQGNENIHEAVTTLGWKDYISLEKLVNSKDQYLPHNNLTILCKIEYIKNSMPDHKKLSNVFEQTEIFVQNKAVKSGVVDLLTYRWEVENYCYFFEENDYGTMFVESPKVTINLTNLMLPFRLRLYPQGNVVESECRNTKNVSLLILFEERNDTINMDEFVFQFKVSILDESKQKHNTKICKVYPNDINKKCTIGWKDYISVEYLMNIKNNLLPDDRLTIYCEVKLLENSNEELNQLLPKLNGINGIDSKFDTCIRNADPCMSKLAKQNVFIIKHVHKWTVNNFQMYFGKSLTENYSKKEPSHPTQVESNYFSLLIGEDIQFKLILMIRKRNFTKAAPSNKTENWLSIFLHCQNSNDVVIQFRISLFDENQQKFNSKDFLRAYDSQNNKHGIENYLQIGYLMDKTNGLLPDDKLTILCEIYFHANQELYSQLDNRLVIDKFTSKWKCQSVHDIVSNSESHTSLNMYRFSHKWTIGEFSELENPNPFKPFVIDFPNIHPQNFDNVDILLRLFPNNNEALKITLLLNSKDKNDLTVWFDLSILDITGTKGKTKADKIKLIKESKVEWSNFSIKRNCLFDIRNNFLRNDELVIFCEGQIYVDPIGEDIQLPECRFMDKLNDILKLNQPSDFVLLCKNEKKLFCHKAVLATHSPIFRAMFDHGFEEDRTNEIDFTEEDADMYVELLRYLYTGKIYKLSKFAEDFLIISDKYALFELKSLVEDWLCTNITPDVLVNWLVLADMYDARKLKNNSIQYFHKNAKSISKQTSFQELVSKKPDLLAEIYLNLAQNFNDCLEAAINALKGGGKYQNSVNSNTNVNNIVKN